MVEHICGLKAGMVHEPKRTNGSNHARSVLSTGNGGYFEEKIMNHAEQKNEQQEKDHATRENTGRVDEAECSAASCFGNRIS